MVTYWMNWRIPHTATILQLEDLDLMSQGTHVHSGCSWDTKGQQHLARALPGPLVLYSGRTLESLKWSEVTQLCQIHCDPMDCSLPGYYLDGESLKEFFLSLFFKKKSSALSPDSFLRISGNRVWKFKCFREALQMTIICFLFVLVLRKAPCKRAFSLDQRKNHM